MIDRRAFLQRTGAGAALLGTSGVSGAMAAERAPQTATSDAADGLDPSHLFIGFMTSYDSDRQAVVNNTFELWTTANGCAVVMGDGQGGERRSIVFDQPQVVWAFTCLTRLIQQQGSYHQRESER